MKRILFAVFAVVIAGPAFAQLSSPVKWSYQAVKQSADTYQIVLTATVSRPWHIYSQNTGKGGPLATSVSFKANPLVMMSGSTKESGKLQKVFDKNFKANTLYYSDQVQFIQVVKVKKGAKTALAGAVEYMAATDSQALPPAKNTFSVTLQ